MICFRTNLKTFSEQQNQVDDGSQMTRIAELIETTQSEHVKRISCNTVATLDARLR